MNILKYLMPAMALWVTVITGMSRIAEDQHVHVDQTVGMKPATPSGDYDYKGFRYELGGVRIVGKINANESYTAIVTKFGKNWVLNDANARLAISPSGNAIAIDSGGTVKLLDAADGRIVENVSLPDNYARGTQRFLTDRGQDVLAYLTKDGDVLVAQTKTLEPTA